MQKKVYQKIHKRCGGRLILAEEANRLFILCEKCLRSWKPMIGKSKNIEWRNIKNNEAKK